MTPTKRVERIFRLPRGLYGKLKREAERNQRSANAELIVALKQHLDGEKR